MDFNKNVDGCVVVASAAVVAFVAANPKILIS